ncbi:MAG: SDR family NAD(P)-dependent oxidoreductase, partial [Bacteroidia bacterium]|nr:SDR family NAD(P)-dependent oxidoreductase [Bacteroidia bacterium]
GPNTQINAACASTTQALGMAKDWIDAGRCKRVIVIAGDDITADDTLGWFTSGFLAAGAAATDDKVENAALPFDKRRHGMIVGMGGAAIVVESGSSAQHRGIQPICEVLGTTYANSAFHGTRLDIDHIRMIMDDMVSKAEQQWGVSRHDMAKQMVFVSHETYTPARGGSASAEINALRHVFKSSADDIVIANTKGMTGHAMAVGIEDVLAIKALETGLVPPVPNFKEIDPELGQLNLSKGGSYPIAFALRLGAGFGSQISMSLLRWTPVGTGVRPDPDNLGFNYRIADEKIWTNWLKEVSGQDNPDLEVIKRTLRIKDPLADKLTDVKETAPATAQPAQKAVQAQPAVVQAEPATAVTTAVNPVQTKILELIAEKTGYPVDMLDPELDLEADLGIDTVKQAELFAEIRGEYGIERDDALQLADFPTLNHIIGFVFDKKPELRQSAAPVVQQKVEPAQPAVISTPQSAGGKTEIEQKVLSLIAEKTGYPEDMLDLELDLEADLGIDTVKQAELFAEVRGSYGIERDETLQLAEFPTLNHIIQFVLDKRPDLAAASTAVPVVAPDSTSVSAPQESPVTEPVSKGSVGDGVQQKVLTLIAEKTGYPEDMLELDLDLEADLGIDTVKQAELFAEIRGEYGIDRDDNLQLAEFPTLNHIIQFVYDKKPELVTAAVSVPVSEPQPVSAQSTVETSTASTSVATQDGVKETILTLIAEKTGYPEDMLELDLDLEADLGIDTVKQAELFAEIRGEYGIERDDNLQLADYPTLNHIIGFVHEKRPDIAASVAAPPTTEPVASQDPVESTVSTASADDDVKTQVLNLVAEKTGYPEDMLDLDLDLEADLGIDTVKQAELFADIRGVYGIERDETLQLADYPTLNHIIGFVNERKPDVGSSSTKVSEAISGSNGLTPGINLAQGDLEAVSQIPRRIPIPQLLPDLEYCKAAGVTLDKDSHVIVMMDTGGVGKALVTQLKKKGVTVRQLKDVASRKALSVVLKDWSAQGPFTGVYWLPGLDIEKEISQMSYDEWKATTESHVKLLYATMRELVMSQDEPAFLVSGTRMGGQLGYDPKGALSSLGGAISGFTKAYKREHSEAQVKVVDFEKSRKTTAFAKTLVDETLYDPGAVEIGHKNGKRWTIGLREMPLSDDKDGMQLDQDTTFLVTGAAGSITSAITADLAQASGGTFYLMDLTPVPDKSDPDLVRFASDKEGLKRDIFTRLKEAGEKATPVMVDKALSAIERKYSALAAIEAIENAGGTAHYYSVNLLDHKAMKKAVKSIVKDAKKIDVLLHAGGIEISRMLPDKSENEFDLVFDIKADGWYNLVSSLGDTPLGAAVVFSSIAGRFGNGGQTDYSAANDFLCKSISGFRTTKPETRGLALDWTAWKDIGMAARGSIPTVMKQAGIDMLPPEAGIPFIRKELITSQETTEIVVAQNLGIMLEEFDVTGGLDTAPAGPVDQLIKKSKGVMIQKALGMGIYSGFTTKAMFDPKEQGFLYDHEINGKPVLPGVMGIEAMVEAATLLFPDLHFKAVEGVDFKAPFKFYRSEPRDVMVKVVFEQDGSDLIGHCELFGARKLHGQEQEEVTTHFTAKVRMSKKPQKTPDPLKPQTAPSSKKSTALADDIYKLYFHGPAYQVIEKSWIKGDATVGLFAKNMPRNHSPESLQTMAMPRLVELCFQTAGIKEMGTEKYMGLPEHIESLQIYQHPKSSRARLYAVVDQRDGSYDADIVDSKGEVYLSLKGYKTAEFITEIDKKLLEPLAVAMD